MENYSTGSIKSPIDLRTFKYEPEPVSATVIPWSGGRRWPVENIRHQHKVGICTAISTTMHASKHYGVEFSPEFQYLCQKKYYDNLFYTSWPQWMEGSSILHALKVGKSIGFLPKAEMDKWITEADRFLPYDQYVAKLKAIPEAELERMKKIASKYKASAYALIDVSNYDKVRTAINSSLHGLLAHYRVGREWWTPPVEPLRSPKTMISGHAVNVTNYTGGSVRIANSWGPDWVDNGTAYSIYRNYIPVELWAVWFASVPASVVAMSEKLEANKNSITKQFVFRTLQAVINLFQK